MQQQLFDLVAMSEQLLRVPSYERIPQMLVDAVPGNV